MMGTGRVRVDLLNPGQVFACLGLMEATERLCGACEGVFEAEVGATEAVFVFETPVTEVPLEDVLRFLREADVEALAPVDYAIPGRGFGVPTRSRSDHFFPSPEPDTPAALPIRLTKGSTSIPVEHWADGSSRDNVKFWAGSGGYSGAALARDALKAVTGLGQDAWRRAVDDPFNAEATMSSSFRFDWRRDYVALDLGFSIDKQRRIECVGYPFVEVLAAIGLEHARPKRVNPRNKLDYRYAVWTELLPTTLARCALGSPSSFVFPMRRFRMRLGWPGQEGQARCIVDAYEE